MSMGGGFDHRQRQHADVADRPLAQATALLKTAGASPNKTNWK